MNQQTTTTQTKITAADIPLSLKARYVGTGFVMGVIAAPTVRGVVAKVVPRFNELLDKLTGQAEGLVESGSDILAQAKDLLRREDSGKAKFEVITKKKPAKKAAAAKPGASACGHDHDHDHDHANDHIHAAPKSPLS